MCILPLHKSKSANGGADPVLYTFLLGGLILSLALLLAVSGLVFAQHRIPLELRQSHNVPISIIYGAISVTFGVIIGFSAYLVLNIVGMESALLHVFVVGALTACLAFTMFTTITLDQPFGGELRVSPEAFEMVLSEIEGDSSPPEA